VVLVLSDIFAEDAIVALCESYFEFRYCVNCARFGPNLCLHCEPVDFRTLLRSTSVTIIKISDALFNIHFSDANDLDLWNYYVQDQHCRVEASPDDLGGTQPYWELEHEQFDPILRIRLWKSVWEHASVCVPDCMENYNINSKCLSHGKVVLTVYIQLSDFDKSVHRTIQ
jgi:hypothetical protein